MTHRIKDYYRRMCDFGLVFFVRYHIIGRKKDQRFKQQVVLNYLKEDLLSDGKIDYDGAREEHAGIQPVWVCWWQGEEEMPVIVKACYNSILTYANGHPVNLITRRNLSEYIELPAIIEKKRQEGLFSLTHYSDHIRFALLAKYGGLWIDSTMLLVDDLPKVFPPLFTLKQKCRDSNYVSDYRWTGFFLGGKDSCAFFSKISNLLEFYWEKHNVLIDYYLVDYIIAALYDTDPDCRKLIDDVPKSNPNLHLLQPRLNLKYDKNEMEKLKDNTSYFKLSWKGNYSKYTNDGQMTYYGQII